MGKGNALGSEIITGWCEPPSPCCDPKGSSFRIGKMIIQYSFAHHDSYISEIIQDLNLICCFSQFEVKALVSALPVNLFRRKKTCSNPTEDQLSTSRSDGPPVKPPKISDADTPPHLEDRFRHPRPGFFPLPNGRFMAFFCYSPLASPGMILQACRNQQFKAQAVLEDGQRNAGYIHACHIHMTCWCSRKVE